MSRITESGQVILAENEFVTVRLERKAACENCGGCITGASGSEMLITAKNLCGAAKDDIVKIELSDERFLSAVFIMYGFPLILLLLGFIGGYMAWGAIGTGNGREAAGFLTGLFAMAVSYLLIGINGGDAKNERYTPRATKIIE